MSQENVEVFKRAFDAINRRDAEGLVSELDPEVEWHSAILMAMGGKQTCSADTLAFASGSGTCTRPSLSFEPNTRRSGTSASGWSQSAASARVVLEARLRSNRLTVRSPSSRTARGFGFEPTSTPTKPSKRLGCWSSAVDGKRR
jgi:hypothetical protein